MDRVLLLFGTEKPHQIVQNKALPFSYPYYKALKKSGNAELLFHYFQKRRIRRSKVVACNMIHYIVTKIIDI